MLVYPQGISVLYVPEAIDLFTAEYENVFSEIYNYESSDANACLSAADKCLLIMTGYKGSWHKIIIIFMHKSSHICSY